MRPFEASMTSIISQYCCTTESILNLLKLHHVVSWWAYKAQQLTALEFGVNVIQALELWSFNYLIITVPLVQFQYRLPICARRFSLDSFVCCVFLKPQLASMCDRNVRKWGDESLQWHCVQRPGTVNGSGLWEVVRSFHMAAFLMTLFGAPCLCGSIAVRLACLITDHFVLFFFAAPAYQPWLLSSRIRMLGGGIRD